MNKSKNHSKHSKEIQLDTGKSQVHREVKVKKRVSKRKVKNLRTQEAQNEKHNEPETKWWSAWPKGNSQERNQEGMEELK